MSRWEDYTKLFLKHNDYSIYIKAPLEFNIIFENQVIVEIFILTTTLHLIQHQVVILLFLIFVLNFVEINFKYSCFFCQVIWSFILWCGWCYRSWVYFCLYPCFMVEIHSYLIWLKATGECQKVFYQSNNPSNLCFPCYFSS